MIIGCDIDDVLNNQVDELLKLYNKKYDDTLMLSGITDWQIRNFLKPECTHLFEEFCTESFIEGLEMSNETIDVLTGIHKEHALHFCTARHPYIMAATDKWLEKYLPWYRSGQLIRAKTKQLLKFDVMIDDNIGNLYGGEYIKLLIDKPWNRQSEQEDDEEGICRIKDLREAYEAIAVFDSCLICE